MKKTFFIPVFILFILLVYFIGYGFFRNPSCYVEDYSVSDDGNEISISFGVLSSVGYIRNARVNRQYEETLYIDCYNAFGGINGHIAAEDTFSFRLDTDITAIALYCGDNNYRHILYKDENGLWQRSR